MSDAQKQRLISEIEGSGPSLTDVQRTAVDTALAAVWTVELLHQVLDAAGQPQSLPIPACDMLQQMRDGVEEIQRTETAGEEVFLNDAQAEALAAFAADPAMPADVLIQQLQSAGNFTEGQQNALEDFLLKAPTQAQWRSGLYFSLLAAGREAGAALSEEQREILLSDYRKEYAWQQTVSKLFLAAHRTKYGWSGDYAGPGSPFWWLYAYAFQPLTATMFAMLAFYVASAAFRAFRAKNLEAILLLGTAFIILLGRTFAGVLLTAWLPDWLNALKIDQMTVYIMSLFNTAGNRAIMIGIALGIASTSLKVLLGVDRSYLGSGDE